MEHPRFTVIGSGNLIVGSYFADDADQAKEIFIGDGGSEDEILVIVRGSVSEDAILFRKGA